MQQQLDKMTATGKLYKSSISGSQVWKTYLSSFKKDPIFRDPESSEHNCNFCNNFIKRYGNIVAIDADLHIITLFDFIPETIKFKSVAIELDRTIKVAAIKNIFFETFENLKNLPYESVKKNAERYKLGMERNVKRYTKEEAELYGVVQPNELKMFEHMCLFLPKQFVKTNAGSIEAIQGEYRDNKEVFKRGMDEISVDTLILVKDLIKQGSLLDGDTHLNKIIGLGLIVMNIHMLNLKTL